MSSRQLISCGGCNKLIEEAFLKDHLRGCQKYHGLAYQRILQVYKGLSIPQLKMLKSQLALCQELLEGQIQSKQVRESNKNMRNISRLRESRIPIIQISSNFSEEKIACSTCKRQFPPSYDLNFLFYVEECWHLFCVPCTWKHINQKFLEEQNEGNLPCFSQNCKKWVKSEQLMKLMGDEKYNDFLMKAFEKRENIVQCFKCKDKFQFIPGEISQVPRDPENKPLAENIQREYVQRRFICPFANCKTQQCRQCQVSPFHFGKTCQEFQKVVKMRKCRYCHENVDQDTKLKTNLQIFQDICSDKECKELARTACRKKLQCGHPCGGVLGEVQCLPCLHEDCAQKNSQKLNGQNGDTYCPLCYVESLSQSPCVMSKCGHIFHEKCLKKRFEIRWLTPRIMFNFCTCALCKQWMQFPQEHFFHEILNHNLNLLEDIQQMALKRLKYEELEKDERLTNETSPYFEKPQLYAMHLYAYFQCFKCKKPYFGGRKNCLDAMNEAQQQFDPKELVCANCCEIPLENCPKHGKEDIQFKCKFCCSVAQWFCWGKTHFCDPCHARQSKGDFLTKYPMSKLPKCQGPGKCPLGGKHGGNGFEKSLGCAQCRNYIDNMKQF